jgi:hypothetical protein
MSDISTINALMHDIIFIPTPVQRRIKAAFWASWGDNPIVDHKNLSLANVMGVVGDSRMQKWWTQPGFKEWFSNQEEFKQRVEYLVHTALDTLEHILVDETANSSARVNAAKLLLEAADKMPRKYAKEKVLDEKINKMGKQELEAWLDRQGVSITGTIVTQSEVEDESK